MSDTSAVQIYSLCGIRGSFSRSAVGNRNIEKVSSTVEQCFASMERTGVTGRIVGNSEVMWLVGVECNIAHGWAHSIAKR